MRDATIAAGVRAEIVRQDLADLRRRAIDRLSDDSGEIGSWLIFAALIAAAAALAGAAIAGWFQQKAADVTSN